MLDNVIFFLTFIPSYNKFPIENYNTNLLIDKEKDIYLCMYIFLQDLDNLIIIIILL